MLSCGPVLNPTDAGLSMKRRLAYLFHECGLRMGVVEFLGYMKGPSSLVIPSSAEHPGPPLYQMRRGSLSGSCCEVKKT